jgi:hypothetical protein
VLRIFIALKNPSPWPGTSLFDMALKNSTLEYGSRVSSGSIVSDCGLDDRAIGVRSPAGAKDFFL